MQSVCLFMQSLIRLMAWTFVMNTGYCWLVWKNKRINFFVGLFVLSWPHSVSASVSAECTLAFSAAHSVSAESEIYRFGRPLVHITALFTSLIRRQRHVQITAPRTCNSVTGRGRLVCKLRPRPLFEARRLSKAQLLFEDLRYQLLLDVDRKCYVMFQMLSLMSVDRCWLWLQTTKIAVICRSWSRHRVS